MSVGSPRELSRPTYAYATSAYPPANLVMVVCDTLKLLAISTNTNSTNNSHLPQILKTKRGEL